MLSSGERESDGSRSASGSDSKFKAEVIEKLPFPYPS